MFQGMLNRQSPKCLTITNSCLMLAYDQALAPDEISMVNIGLNLSSIIGLIHVLGALGYLIVSINQVIVATRSNRSDGMTLRIVKLVFGPLILLISGVILFFDGWRLDPTFLLKEVLMSMLIGYLLFSDLKRSN